MDAPPAVAAAAALDLAVEISDVGPSRSMEEHEAKLGVAPGSLCKTLLVRRGEGDYVFVVVSGGRKMDWKKVREVLGVDRASRATREQLLDVTGFVPGTVTVLGSATTLPVILDAVAAEFDRIAVGSGSPGVSALVDTAAFVAATAATVEDVTVPDDR